MLCADATTMVRLKYALSASSCKSVANFCFVVERLMLITSKPCSIDQRSPASSAAPLPVKPAPSTRTLCSSHSGASERMTPAHAVPWPQRSPSVSSSTIVSSSTTEIATAPSIVPTSGWPISIPLSSTHTRTPLPVEPPHAHSRVTRSGQRAGSAMRSIASAGRLQAGSSSSAAIRHYPAARAVSARSRENDRAMNGEGSGLRERIRRAIEAPVDESQKLLSELKDASPETQLSLLISGWARGLAAGMEELAIAVDELLEREGRAHREPAAATAGEEPALEARP